MRFVLEACVDSPESALAAAQGGATRLELCANLVIGGTTPDPALFCWVRRHIQLPIHVLIRPRFGDFLYSVPEHEIICEQIRTFRDLGADAVVIGVLTPDGDLDLNRMSQMVDCAGSRRVTLHRAFDLCSDPLRTLEQARALGVATILTSGGQADCRDGAPLLNQLVAQAKGLEILVGAGVDAGAIHMLAQHTGASAFHMSGKRIIKSAMRYQRANVPMGLPGLSEYELWRTDPEKIAAARRTLEQIFPD